MRFHLFGAAHVPVRYDECVCPFSTLTHDMAVMIKAAGHELILYGAAGSDAPCDEFVELVGSETLKTEVVPDGASIFRFKDHHVAQDPTWQEFAARGRAALRQRYRAGDIALISFGWFQIFAVEEVPLTVEFCVGYTGTCAPYKVFPSHIWHHYLLHQYVPLRGNDWPSWEDVVIPHYTDKARFPLVEKKEDYYFYLGRLIVEKGVDIAADVARAAGKPLLVAGRCNGRDELPPWLKDKPGVVYVGAVRHARRVELLSQARAAIFPVRYVEAFGMTSIETMACGTPIISSDFGAHVETNVHGLTGFRCHDFDELVQAAHDVDQLSPARIRAHFEATYSLEAVWPQYERYFERILRHQGPQGWYTRRS